ncbi:MAG TPA: hypothetical protein VGB68_05525 [Pyrinomonadaceae bacterium]|jgi:hypothetical protein
MQNTEFRTGVIRPVECFKEGWELIKDQYWLFFVIVLVGMLIGSFIPLGIGLGAMFCGIYYCLFQKMNGQKVEFEGLFKGFNYFVPGLVATLVLIVPAVISALFVYASMIAVLFGSMDSRGNLNETAIWAMMGTVFIEIIALWLILGSLHVFLMFSYPLIVEKNMSGWAAFKLSARAGWANLSGVTGLILIEFVLGLAAYVLTIFVLGFGVYLVMPLMFAGVLVAYRKVFPSAESFTPPNAF